MSDLLKDFRSIFETKVAWGDQDAAQHVNNIMYLRYAESARIQYMDDIGLGFHKGSDNIILADTYVKFIYPLTYPDKIWVGTRCMMETIDETSFKTEQIIVSQRYNKVAAIITAKIVCYDYEKLQKSSWSPTTIDAIRRFEQD